MFNAARPIAIVALMAACDGETERGERMTSSPTAGKPSTEDASRNDGGRSGSENTAGAGGTTTVTGGSSGGGAGGTGGSVASGGGAAAAEGGSDDAADAEANAIVREPPPGVELVPGPAPPPPDPDDALLDYSGYRDASLPQGRTASCDSCVGKFGSDVEAYCCSCCSRGEYCYQLQRHQGPPNATCSARQSIMGTPASGCRPRPSACTDDCPVVCGCDGKLYCNACIANAWGHDITWDSFCPASSAP